MATGWRGEWPPACAHIRGRDALGCPHDASRRGLLPGWVSKCPVGCLAFCWDGLAERILSCMAEGSLGSSGDLGWTLQLGCLSRGDGEHQWGPSWLLWESWLPSQADRQVSLVRSRAALEGLRWVGRAGNGRGAAPSIPPTFSRR